MSAPHRIRIGALEIANDAPLALISGPCQIESRDHALACAERLVEITSRAGIGLIYKSSFDKANRTSIESQRGIGIDEGLKILAAVREAHGCPVLTDVHAPEQCAPVADAVDVLQIPAFLCRQTDLVVAAAETGTNLNMRVIGNPRLDLDELRRDPTDPLSTFTFRDRRLILKATFLLTG